MTRWHGDIVRGPTIKLSNFSTGAQWPSHLRPRVNQQNSSQSYLKMVQKLPAKLPRNLVPDPDGQPRVDPVSVDPQNRGRNRNRMNEAENNETKFQQKLHFSKNFFLSFLTSFSKTCDKFYFLTILFILSSFNFDCFQVVVFETNKSNLKSLLSLFQLFWFFRGTRKYQQSTISAPIKFVFRSFSGDFDVGVFFVGVTFPSQRADSFVSDQLKNSLASCAGTDERGREGGREREREREREGGAPASKRRERGEGGMRSGHRRVLITSAHVWSFYHIVTPSHSLSHSLVLSFSLSHES